MFRWPIIFTSKRRWHVWGSQIEFRFPSWRSDLRDMQDTHHRRPGKESLNFYDSAFDATTGEPVHVGMATVEHNYIPEEAALLAMDTSEHKLICARRRYNNAWAVKYGDDEQSFWADIWIYRDYQHGDLNIGDNLQRAHLNYLKRQRELMLEYREKQQQAMLSEGDESEIALLESNDGFGEYTALNWREREVGGLFWQGYDECSTAAKMAQMWLFPLGRGHYLGLRMYRMRVGFVDYQEFEKAFERFTNYILNSMRLQSAPDVHYARLSKGAEVDPSQLAFTDSDAEHWQALNQRLKGGDARFASEKCRQAFWRRDGFSVIAYMLGGIFAFACVVIGAYQFNRWLQVQEYSYGAWLIPAAFIASAVVGRIQKLKARLIRS